MIRAVQSGSARLRLHEARHFLLGLEPGTEVLLVGASRGSADDCARSIALERGVIFGLHRFSFTQLAARLAAVDLATRGRTSITPLGYQAVATRATFEAARDTTLEYLVPVHRTPGFSKALASTLIELRLAGIAPDQLAHLSRGGSDLADLLERVEALLAEAGAGDRAALFEAALRAVNQPSRERARMPVVLLDVPMESAIEASFLLALIQNAPNALVTIPWGDMRASEALEQIGTRVELHHEAADTDLVRLQRHLFSTEPPDARGRTGELVWFSAPGEGRECLEIARRLLKESAAGVRFDEMAILLRSPQQYFGLLEHALERAGIPAHFDRGTRRPDPAGRAFLALLSCATENLSARRFAEYLSLAQVPSLSPQGTPEQSDTWTASADEELGVVSASASADDEQAARRTIDAEPENPNAAIVNGTLRAPWRWERLLVESAVIGGQDRWARRLDGLAEEYRVRIAELADEDPDDARIEYLTRELQNLDHLRAFALPLIAIMSAWPDRADWGGWIRQLETFARRVLRRPDHVLQVLAGLRPMADVGPVTLVEVRQVLADRLRSLEVEPLANRYSKVFVGSPHQARGRSFRVVFVPGLAERLFPHALREDPLLLDDLRVFSTHLLTQEARADFERLLLRLAVGAATDRLYVSYPRIESTEARARVPSFYALELMRAVTSHVPDHVHLQEDAAMTSDASLAWPAPTVPADAIDEFEHDLSVLRVLMKKSGEVKGRAHYMLLLNANLRRSVTERWARTRHGWSQFDGLVRATDRTRPILQTQRLTSRPFSVSALQHYATCPYQFLLSALYRLAPREEPEPLQRLDPLTKGSLFHSVQAEFFRALQAAKLLPLRETARDAIVRVLDATIERVAAEYYERLAPAIERVWRDEIAAIRTDLHVWVGDVISTTTWEPWLFEYAFGLPEQAGRDPNSRPDPVTIDGRFKLRGAIDLVERKPGTRVLRVTDHKTSKNRSERNAVIGHGTMLQPVVYSLAAEAATDCVVESGRFSYCTSAGGFTDHVVPINDRSRRTGIEVLEIVDRAIELGAFPPAPTERACSFCDFRPVCGPDQERRVKRKSDILLADLLELRSRP